MNRDRRSSSNDPTAERTADQSTQSASGLSAGRHRDEVGQRRDPDELRYNGPLHTPRRYDQPIEEDDDPVMTSEDATVDAKI